MFNFWFNKLSKIAEVAVGKGKTPSTRAPTITYPPTTTTSTTTTTAPPTMIPSHPIRPYPIGGKAFYYGLENPNTMESNYIRQSFPRSHYRQLEVDLLKQEMDRAFYEMKAAQSKFHGLQKRLGISKAMMENDQEMEWGFNNRMLQSLGTNHLG